MSLGNNKVLKITWWSGHSATSGNWTVSWFGRWGLVWHFTSLGTVLRFLGTSHFSRFLWWWYLQGYTGFRGLAVVLGNRDDETFWQASLIQHVDGLMAAPNACWLLTAFEVSSISPEDLSILRPDVIWMHIYLLLYTSFEPSILDLSAGFTRTISPLLKGGGGEFLGTDVVVLS